MSKAERKAAAQRAEALARNAREKRLREREAEHCLRREQRKVAEAEQVAIEAQKKSEPRPYAMPKNLRCYTGGKMYPTLRELREQAVARDIADGKLQLPAVQTFTINPPDAPPRPRRAMADGGLAAAALLAASLGGVPRR